jgi:hypothetical protein
MVPAAPGVNRGVCPAFVRRVLARMQRKPENTRRHHLFDDAMQQINLCGCTIASAILLLSHIALISLHRSRQTSSGKALSR